MYFILLYLTSPHLISPHFTLLYFRTAPVGIASVIASNIVETEDVGSLFQAMGMYVVANVSGFIILGCIFYPALYFVFFRRSPLQHIAHIMPALMTAIGTSSR